MERRRQKTLKTSKHIDMRSVESCKSPLIMTFKLKMQVVLKIVSTLSHRQSLIKLACQVSIIEVITSLKLAL